MTRYWPIALLLVTTGSSACRKRVLPTTTLQIGKHSLLVEVADNGETRSRGLMYRDSMPANEGMVFVYPDSAPRGFWMKNVRFPLSIAFADPDGNIVSIADMRPMSSRSTPSVEPAMYAVETNKGWFEEHDISVGDRIVGLPESADR